ncbi:MAG: HAD family hydrolase [Candidatus Bathyarchaeota archaeon]|nr:HAD family hydrolase [Candidatus Bathyarchaeota archaeon]
MNLTPIKAKGIFLDLDGTLVDSTGAYLEAARIAFQAVGEKPPELEVALEIPRRLEQGLPLSDLAGGNGKRMLGFYFDAYYSVTETKTRLLPNVSAALEALAYRTKLAVVTMRHVPKQVIQKELDYFGIAKYFAHVVTGLDTCKPKPSPEALVKCVEKLDLNMSDCIMAGDSVSDIRAGKAAGAKTIAFLSGLFRPQELAKEKPDLILPDVSALPEFI